VLLVMAALLHQVEALLAVLAQVAQFMFIGKRSRK
jgi:hypothetical protein